MHGVKLRTCKENNYSTISSELEYQKNPLFFDVLDFGESEPVLLLVSLNISDDLLSNERSWGF